MRAFLAFNGDARIICDLLAAPRQNIEKGCLAAIGVANQRDERKRSATRGVHGLSKLRLLRTHANAGGFEQPQRESTGANAHGDRCARQ